MDLGSLDLGLPEPVLVDLGCLEFALGGLGCLDRFLLFRSPLLRVISALSRLVGLDPEGLL